MFFEIKLSASFNNAHIGKTFSKLKMYIRIYIFTAIQFIYTTERQALKVYLYNKIAAVGAFSPTK